MKCIVKWLGQAGYLLEIDGLKLCVDPYLSNSVEEAEGMARLIPAPFEPENMDADWLLFTHDHLDHYDGVSIDRITRTDMTYVGPASCIKRLGDKPAKEKITINCGETVILGGKVAVSAVFAKHTPDSVGFVFRSPDDKEGGLYLTGDTLYDDELLKVKDYAPSVIVVCINGKLGNMNCVEAARVAESIGAKIAVPCHYGMFAGNTEDPEKFRDSLSGKDVEYKELNVMEPCVFEL